MRGFAASALVLVPCGALPQASGSDLVNDVEHIARLNAEKGSLWVAAPQKFFEGLTMDDARRMLGTHLSHISNHMNMTLPDSAYAFGDQDQTPADFDSRKQWPGLIHPIRDQQQCGSCWAFSASEVLSDRVAIASGRPSPVLSAEDLVSCDRGDMGCSGGRLDSAWKYLVDTGLVTDNCFPYTAGAGIPAMCASECLDSESFTRTRAHNSYAIHGPVNMQRELMQNGPIQVAFKVYRSFMSYQSGIYHKHIVELLPEGGHAVKMVGWGVDNDTNYWSIANSWNTNWGEEGFFRIRRGRDECGIEKMGPPFAGVPTLPQPKDDVVLV